MYMCNLDSEALENNLDGDDEEVSEESVPQAEVVKIQERSDWIKNSLARLDHVFVSFILMIVICKPYHYFIDA